MKEIGGYFGLEELIHKEYYPDLIAVNNARSALLYILKAKKIEKLYIPRFLCGSISGICEREGYEYEYYSIDKDFSPMFEKELGVNEYLYVVNYYGQISNEKLLEIKEKNINVIFDNAQAFFQQPIESVDTIYSCHKFFGVPDGGYVATNARLEENILVDISKDRMKHVLGRFEGEASEYYADYKENNRSFRMVELRYMSKLTHNILGAIDYERVVKKRIENYSVLEKLLGDRNGISPIKPYAPYAYPFYCKNGMNIKKLLSSKKIYVATLWPSVLDRCNEMERDYVENILPLPIDQRYDVDDMKYIAKEVLRCIN